MEGTSASRPRARGAARAQAAARERQSVFFHDRNGVQFGEDFLYVRRCRAAVRDQGVRQGLRLRQRAVQALGGRPRHAEGGGHEGQGVTGCATAAALGATTEAEATGWTAPAEADAPAAAAPGAAAAHTTTGLRSAAAAGEAAGGGEQRPATMPGLAPPRHHVARPRATTTTPHAPSPSAD